MSEAKCIFVGLVKELSGHEYGRRVYSTEGVSPTVVCGMGGYQDIKIIEYEDDDCLKVKANTKKGYIEAKDGDFLSTIQPNSTTRRGRVQSQVSATLMTGGAGGGGS